MWPMIAGAAISAAGSAASAAGSKGGSMSGGGDDAASSSYDPTLIQSNVIQSMLGTQNVSAESKGEAEIASQYDWPQQYYSTTLLPVQYAIEQDRLRALSNAQTSAAQFGTDKYIPFMNQYLDSMGQLLQPTTDTLISGYGMARNAYDSLNKIMSHENTINDDMVNNILLGQGTLRQLQNEAAQYDPNREASVAAADAMQAYNGQPQQLMQQLAGMGVSADSGAAAAALAGLGTERAGGVSQAWSAGRRAGEDTKFNRQSTLAGANAGLNLRNTAVNAAQVAPSASLGLAGLSNAAQAGQSLYNFGLGAGAAAAFPYYKPSAPTTYSDVAKNLYYASSPMSDALKYSQTSTGASQGSSVMGGLGSMASGIGGRMFGSGLDKMLAK